MTYDQLETISKIGDKDKKCFAELREVLERHGALERFGVCLLHDHFDVGDDEILEEVCDETNRVLTAQPVDRASWEAKPNSRATMWELKENRALQGCIFELNHN